MLGCWLLGITLTYVAASAAADAAPRTHTVLIENMRFSPAELTVRRGDRVVFQNNDLMPHTATSSDSESGKFDSGLVESGKSWTLHVNWTGQVPYRCTFHPTMTGIIRVDDPQ